MKLFREMNSPPVRWMILLLLLFFALGSCEASDLHHFVVEEAPYTRLCETKNILTVNGEFPGPTIRVTKGETIYVEVHNKGRYNITLHWHGVKQPSNPWSDGPEYITQCPIQPGSRFTYKVIFSTEEGTVWWHAHSDWSRATVYGAIIVYPRPEKPYPFPQPDDDVPIVLGEWWKEDVMEVLEDMLESGGDPIVSDAFTINGQPGDLYPCSDSDTFRLTVEHGKRYLLRIVNAAMNIILFFSIRRHQLIVVGSDGSYTKPLTVDYIAVSPGQTMDALLVADQPPGQYYMAARAYSTGVGVPFDNTTTTAILQYNGIYPYYSSSSYRHALPDLPYYNDTSSAFSFLGSLRSLADEDHPIDVPQEITVPIFSTFSVNTFACDEDDDDDDDDSCQGPNGTRLAASMNNISFSNPNTDILKAYYDNIDYNNRVFGDRFPRFPPMVFDFTAEYLPLILEIPKKGTEVIVLEYGSSVEIVMQGTNLVAGIDHPIHLHGYSFFIVGWGLGNFDPEKDPLEYNLIDPPLRNTVTVPKNGWATVRFRAENPGVWYLHCHIERHLTWGMSTVLIVKNGAVDHPQSQILPPPPDMPPC